MADSPGSPEDAEERATGSAVSEDGVLQRDWKRLEVWWAETGSVWWERLAAVLARPLVAILAIATAVLYLGDDIDLEKAAIVFFGGLIVVAVLMPPRRWKGLADRFESFKLSGFGLGVEAKRAAAQTPESEAEAPVGDKVDPEGVGKAEIDDVLALRLKFEAKLAYIVKHLLNEEACGSPRPPEFATVGSLRHDGYLTDDQARLAVGILTVRESDLAQLSASEREKFFKEADDFVTNMRASVFDGMVRKRLRDNGWAVSDLDRAKKAARPDISVSPVDDSHGPRFVVAPTYAMRRGSEILDRARARLGSGGADRGRLEAVRRIIVVPNRSEVEPVGEDVDPQVLTLSRLVEALAVSGA
jgi:hypothetical protein